MRDFIRRNPEPANGQTLAFAVNVLGYGEFAGMSETAFRALHARIWREVYPDDNQAAAA